MNQYDYIICGAGAAGLSLAVRLCGTKYKVLLLDKDAKQKNDRTFCYWHNSKGYFDEIVTKKWSHIIFESKTLKKNIDIAPYEYNMIQGDKFYNFCLKKINASSNIQFVQTNILSITEEVHQVIVTTDHQDYTATEIFKSFPDTSINFSKSQFVIQHFFGWEIETKHSHFDVDVARFMDFNIEQDGETRFMYVLPTSEKKALVELAIFSNNIPDNEFYESTIGQYIKDALNIDQYKILAKEKGSIPMTNYDFAKHDTNRVIHIGTAAGVVKPSSGYAFQRIQEHSDILAELIRQGKRLQLAQDLFKSRFKLYDSVFLNVLLTNKSSGSEVFSELFKQLPVGLIFKFLDEKTNIFEELRLFTGPPTMPFIKAFFEEV